MVEVTVGSAVRTIEFQCDTNGGRGAPYKIPRQGTLPGKNKFSNE